MTSNFIKVFETSAAPNRCDFQCTSEAKCLPSEWILDNVKDCKDGEDEDPNKVDQCLYKKSKCDRNANCTKIVNGNYTCTCNPPFTGNGFICNGPAVAGATPPTTVAGQSKKIKCNLYLNSGANFLCIEH